MEVPRPAERDAIVRKSHDDAGHCGVERTASLVAAEYWWHGMHAPVRMHVRSCDTCARVEASFVPRNTTLHPLPIMGMFCHWSVNLVGPFPQSYHGNYSIMVMR